MKNNINLLTLSIFWVTSGTIASMDKPTQDELKRLVSATPGELGLQFSSREDEQKLVNALTKQLRLKEAQNNLKKVNVSKFKKYLATQTLTAEEKQELLNTIDEIEIKGGCHWGPNWLAIGLRTLDIAVVSSIPIFVKVVMNDMWVKDANEILTNYSKECGTSYSPTKLPDVKFGLYTAIASLHLLDNLLGFYSDHQNQFYKLEDLKIALEKKKIFENEQEV